jgi:hypothetical protein
MAGCLFHVTVQKLCTAKMAHCARNTMFAPRSPRLRKARLKQGGRARVLAQLSEQPLRRSYAAAKYPVLPLPSPAQIGLRYELLA